MLGHSSTRCGTLVQLAYLTRCLCPLCPHRRSSCRHVDHCCQLLQQLMSVVRQSRLWSSSSIHKVVSFSRHTLSLKHRSLCVIYIVNPTFHGMNTEFTATIIMLTTREVLNHNTHKDYLYLNTICTIWGSKNTKRAHACKNLYLRPSL